MTYLPGEEKPDGKKAPPWQPTKEQIEVLKPLLKNRIPVNDGPGCFLCKWIYEDLEKNSMLTDYSNGSCGFPETAKHVHLKLEGMIQ